MVSKNNIEMRNKKMRDEKQRFSIRKFSVGAASVLIGLSFSLYNGQQASADTVDNGNKSVVASSQDKEQTDNNQSVDTNTQNNEDKTNTNQTQTTVTDDLDHSTVVASYKADTPNNTSESNNSSENTENKSDEKLPAATETVKTDDTATKPVESKNTANDGAAKENVEEAAKTNTATDVNKKVVENVKTEAATTNVDTKNNETQTAKTDEEKVETATIDNTASDLNKSVADATTEVATNTFNVNDAVKNASFLSARAATESKVATRVLAAEAEDPNAVNVTTAQELMNALSSGTATTINIANNINMGDIKTGENINVDITNKRNITIQSSGATKSTVDFNGYSFKMNSNDYGVAFKNITLYGRSYFGIVRNAGSYTFDNVDYTGSQLVYTESGYNSTVNFNGTVNANSVGSYVGLNGTTYRTQGGGNQQVLQFRSGTNTINFNENSTVNLVTTNANVIENGGGTTSINVKKGANVILEPHTQTGMEQFFSVDGIARGIASNATTNLTIDEGATLNISLKDNDADKYHSSALYLNSGATINNNGNLTITSDGTPYYKASGIDAPIYINGTAVINVGNTGNLTLTATNVGTYNGDLMKINGTGTVKLDPHSTFKISADGTGALTAINLSSGSTFTSDQPKEFTIDLSANTSSGKTLIKNGTINFTRVKNTNVASQYQVALGKVDVTYSSAGALSNSVINSLNKDVPTKVYDYIKSNPSALSFVAAGEDVTLNSLHLDKNNQLTGIATSTGDSKTPIYITVLINNSATGIPEAGMYRLYTDTDGNISTTKVTYTGTPKNSDGSPKPNGGEFSIDLSSLASQLTDDAKITVVASKDFVESPTLTETVEALRQVNIDALQKLVDAAPEEEQKPSYYNATEEAQMAYNNAIAAGQEILDSPTSYDQSDVDRAVSVIQLALTALTGKETDKTALQTAVDQASSVESSDNYTNADTRLQDDYQTAIKAGQGILSKENATQTEVDNALTTINNAKAALNGDAKKAASKEALQKAVDEAPTVKSDDAAYYNGSAEAKTAYDNAITAGQTVLDNPDATATQITDALNAINTAKGNLKGEATDKSALQTAVDNSATVKESNNYTNADETQKTAYDNAVTAAQTVLNKTNATQAEVNQALQDLETANNNLNGDAKTEAANKAALEAAVKDAPNVRNTSAYYNGSEEAQTAYNNAITAGQAVLNETNPSASEVKNALDAINAAKDNLKGESTNTEALETALTNANNAKNTGNYTNADQANQEALNNAITAGQEILKNTNATQAEVDNAAKSITDAINGLNGDTNLANAKNAATEDIQKALDTKTTEITDATNIDQATKDQLIADAKKAAEDANTAINQVTNANAVNTAKTEGITKINNVKIPSLDDAKTNAAKEIDQALADKTKEINSAENIDQTTKDQLIKEATDAANTAKDAIKKSTTNDEATKAGQAGVDAINNVKVPSVTDSQNAAKEAIDDALNSKTKEINDANNIDQTTKDQLIKEATDAANKAKEAIDQATTADAIKTAQDEGTININNVTVPSLEDAKKAANKAVDDALTAQTEVINKATNLSDAEKKDLIDQATAEANKAKENIETATTNNEAAQAGQAGVDAIKKIVPTSLDTVKSDANKAIDDALTKKLEEINSANDLTTDEKTALTQEANTAADKAKEEITNATTNDAVIEAQNNGVTAIDGIKVPTESAVKEAAKKAVADAATAKNQAIDASNLTDEEKAALKQKVTEAQNAADQAIDNATTNVAVTEAQTNGVNAINGIEVTSSVAKEAAKQAVADAATAKNNAIDASNLTDEEKAALKQKVTDAQNAADQAIDNATTNAAVTEAQTNGINAINGIEVPAKSDAKEQAITDLNTAVDEAKKAIDQDSNLTDEQKQAAKDQIDSDAKTAQEAINNAKTNDDVKKAADDGTLAIDKDVANAAIDNAVAGKKNEISKSSLTDEEKTALNNEVDQKANVAKEAINAATSPEAVTSAQENGIKNINDTSVPTESPAKEAAKQAVAEAADAKNKAIDSSNLTDEEKAALKQKVTDAQTAADQAIDNATTNAGVTEAQNKGVSAIDGIEVPTTSANKEKAITDLNNEVENAKKAIDQDNNLTDEQKQAAKDQIDSDAKKAQDAINNAKTDNDVNNAVNSGKVAINKDVANAAIDNAVADKLKEIQDPLTTEEKQAYTDLINSEANNAKQNIANATTVEEVTTAQTNGVNEITNTEIPTTSSVKEKAIAAINDALQKKTDEINNASNINTKEKTDLINQANEAANAAKNNINNATTNADVDTAQTNGEKAIADVTVPNLSDVKKESIDLVNKALDAKTAEINNASNLSQDEKQSLINDATNAATEAINNVNQAQTNDDAKAAATTGVQNIENVTIPSLDDAKKNANQAIDDALNSKVNEINNASNLNDTEKQKLVDQATEAATTAKNNVENATTNDAARDAANAGIDNIKGIRFTSLEDAKKVANTAIDNALQVKTDEINNASNLSTEEKQDLINQATEVAKNAKDNINNATTNDAVTEAQNEGIADIANVTVPSLDQVKQDAINAIKQVQDAKNKQISAASNLSAEEQKELSDQVDKIANDAIAKINDSTTTTNDAVTATRDDAIKQITDLFIPTLDGAQTDAINAIESAKNAKLNDINNAAHLTAEEKQALVDQTNKAAADATKEIKAAQTNDAVKSAETAGLDNINNITIPTLVQKQQEAIEELNAARDAKNSAIDNATDLTTDEKNNLKDKVQAEYSNAVSNITRATTDEAVTTAKENGIAAIKDIEIPTKSATKEQATTDLNTAVDEAKKAIDQDNNLTDEQKQAAKDQIDSDAKKAQDAINNAKTNDDVKKAVDDGKLAIDKDVANAAIDNAVAGKKEEISKSPLTDEEKTALNNEVDQKAQDAKEAINNATTPEAVTTAQENGIKNITNTEVPTESAAKEAAKKAVAEAAEAKNNAIDSSNLTDEEKAALKQEVSDAQNAANTAIDNATTNAAVTQAQNNGIDKINSIEVSDKSAAKDQATTDLNNAVDEAKKAIDQDNNLTDEEKQAAKDQIDSDAKTAQDAINNAKTNDDVKKAVEDGKLAIDKDIANAAIDNAVTGKKAEISNSPLTDEEKTALNNEVDQKAQAAKESINNATTPEAVISAKESGIKNINDTEVPAESAAKQSAKEAVAKAADEKNAAIDSSNLTDEEKAVLKQEVTDTQNAANQAIDTATTDVAVTDAEENGIKAINSIEVPTKSTAKDQATTDLNNEVDDAKKAIDQDNNLTDEQKQAAKDQIDSDAKKAQEAIDNAKTNDDVKKAIDDGKLAIDKDVANAAIDNAVAGKKAEISKSSLTDEEKAALNNEVDEEAQAAKEAIKAATTSEAVTEAQNNGIKSINNIVVPSESVAKEAAKKAVAEAAEAKNNAIDSSNLTDEEKDALKQEVTDAQNAANTAIDSATTNAAVAEAQNNGIDKINSIEISAKSAAKEQATTDLNNEVDEAKKAIDQDNNLTDEQKQAAKDQIDSDAKKAQEAIDNAKTNDDVKKAIDDGKLAIDKDVANAAIDDAAAGKLKEINDSLTDEEKQAYTDLINNEADNAKQKIADSTTPEEVTRAQEEGVKDINNINVPTTSPAKDAANAAIDQALKNKEDEINTATNISSEEKADLIKQATEAANIAKDNINNATTNSEVETAQVDGEKAIADVTVPGLSDIKKESIDIINKALNEKQDLIDQAKKVATEAIDEINNAQTNDETKQAADTGVKNIENISIPSLNDAKNNANQAIDDALNSKKNEISNASNLTDSEKTDLINQATEIANAAKDSINSATTNTAVEAAEDKGVADINNIHFTNLDDSKKAANSAIDDALNTKKDEINNASNLSDSEKAQLINQATEIAQKAHDAINNATTNSAVTAAENKGIEDIANVNVPSLAETKQAAIDAIKQVQNAKNSQIEEAKNLSADEQKNLIDQVNKIAQDAIDKLNDPATTTNEVITDTRDKAIDQITNLFIPTLDNVQKDAQDAINSAKEAKIDEINKANNLTDQMKQNLIDQVNQVADKATKAINNAQTNDDVKEAETKGLEDIDSIKVPSLVESKDNAIKEIDDALKKKTDEINAADLDQKQKDELISQITDIATETKNKVFNATTNAEVEAETEAGIKAIEAVKIPARTTDSSNTETHDSSTNVTPDHNNAQNTDQVSTNTESESKKQTVTTNSVQPKRSAVCHKNGAPVNKKATLPQTGKKDSSSLTLAGAALLGLAGALSLFGLGDKRKKNK